MVTGEIPVTYEFFQKCLINKIQCFSGCEAFIL
jgi:hypothetical protein